MFFSHLGGDMATTRRYLDMASRATTILDQSNGQNPPINNNCLDPLGRNALLIGIARKLLFTDRMTFAALFS